MAKRNKKENNIKELQSLEKQLIIEPNNIALKVRYGKLLLKSGNITKSENVFQDLIKQDPSNLQAKLGLVEIYFDKGNYSTVIVIAEELAQKNQQSEKIRILHIKALLKQNSMTEAQLLYNKLVSENPFIFDDELLQVFEDSSHIDEEYLEENDFEEDYPFGDDEDFDDDFEDDFFEDDFPDRNGIFEMLEEVLLLREGRLTFKEIIGMDTVKEIMNFKFDFFKREANLLKKHNRPQRASMMMYGPSGCGKTYIMNSFINEFYCSLIPLEMVDIKSIPDLGKQGLVSFAFNYASVVKPVTIFIDNLEGFAPKSDGIDLDITTKTINCFEGLRTNLSEVGVITASGAPWKIAPNIFRYGRIDDLIFVAPPTTEERHTFFKNSLFKKNVSLRKHADAIIDATKGFSYAELAHCIERALFIGTREVGQLKTIKLEHLLQSIKSIDPIAKYWIEELRVNTEHSPRLQHLFKDGLEYNML